jgi:hypothetical protein
LIFEIVSGESSTWGDFGGQGYLRAEVDGDLLNLDTYDPEISVANSGVGFASNRVASLVLKEIRVTEWDDDVHVDSTDRVVHQQ